MLQHHRLNDLGASAVEYGILIGGIAAAVILSVVAIGIAADDNYDTFTNCYATEGTGC